MRLKYQRIITLVLAILAIVTVPSFAAADASSWQERLKQGLDKGMTELAVKRGSPDLCVLTNAPYVKYRGESAIGCLDTVQEATGCSQGKKNLLSYHAAVSKPLRIVLFNKKSGDGVVLTLCRGDRLTEPCSPVEASASGDGLARVKLLLGGEKILEADAYRKVMKKLGPSDAFSITSILNAWAACAPFDFLKACEFHNHYCPGVTSGALMARLINEKYPLEKGQKYVWIGAPPKCGDDALQILLDLTPGKRTCFIKGLTRAQLKQITAEEPLNNVQGILVVWDNKANKGKGLVFTYNWVKACKIAGLRYSDLRPLHGKKDPRFFTTRLKVNRALIAYLDKPSELVSVPKEITVTPEMYVKLISAGSNPYEAAGLTPE